MIGTLLWRLQEAFAVLNGTKRTETMRRRNALPEDILPSDYLRENPELREIMNTFSIEFCFSEFGEQRVNAGGATFSAASRLDPSLSSLKKYFPDAQFTVYSDFLTNIPGVRVVRDESPLPDPEHPRYLYRTADYFKFISLTESTADFCCVMDSDMTIVSPEFYALTVLTQTFGFCAASNPRNLLKKDMAMSFDTAPIKDASCALGHSYNQSPMTLWKNHIQGKAFYTKCAEIMLREPSRASLVMWKAARELGISPYLLPAEWCVCAEDVGIGNEILLHVGHEAVNKYYRI